MLQREIDTRRGVITIRPAQLQDAEDFRDLRLEALRSHPHAFGADYESNLARSLEGWRKRMRVAHENETIFFAVHHQTLIGMTGIGRGDSRKTQHNAWIWGVNVRAEWRGLRLADALLEACREWARERDVRSLKLGVMSTNATAIRCYLRCGFTVYGVEPEMLFYDGVYYDELLMVCRV